MECPDQIHLQWFREFPQLWGLAVLVGELPYLPDAHWQSHYSLMQSPTPHWLGPSSDLKDQEIWQQPGAVLGALPLY